MALPAFSPSVMPGQSFVDLDERLIAASPGVVLVRVPDGAESAIVAHAARRLRRSGLLVIEPAPTSATPLFREVATQLGIGSVSGDPRVCAEAVLVGLVSMRAAIVASMPREGTWDFAVASALVELSVVSALCVFVSPEAPCVGWDAARFEVGTELGAADKLRWLGAVAEEAEHALPSEDVRVLETWWHHARHVDADIKVSSDPLNETCRVLLGCLALAGRSLPVALLATLAADAALVLKSLAARGAVRITGALVAVSPTYREIAQRTCVSDELRRTTAKLLAASGPEFEPDPWSYARAAELLLIDGVVDEADSLIERALRGVGDSQAATEIGERWFAAVSTVSGSVGVDLRLRAAWRALDFGDAIEALRWCDGAARLGFDSPSVALLRGCALMRKGDLVAASVSLERAKSAAATDDFRSRAEAELAEVDYLTGDHERASERAERAIALASTATTRLLARNTLGKIHLARARWDEADAHFASDALDAIAAGDTTAELRARLNRGIAQMFNGLFDEAQEILESVLLDSTRFGATEARAHALSNLAVIAYQRHRFGEALSLWEQAIQMPQTLRGRVASARTIANLAGLRLRIGLVDHAEHAVAFGRRLLGSGTTKARSSHFSVVAAGIALARRNTELAHREIDAAIQDGEAAGNQDFLGEAHGMSARISLEEGDLAAAERSITKAEKLQTSVRSRAEIAILRALHARAFGRTDAIALANGALTAARQAADEDLLGEIHTLLSLLNRDAGDIPSAIDHCERALRLRDQVAEELPADIRAAFLGKPEILLLSRLRAGLTSRGEPADEDLRSTQSTLPPSMPSAREIVGDDPHIRSLMIAIRKVARANSTVLICGESGTGKELVAEALHRASERASGPLISVNCAALVETLLLSELFGHEKGAFTGASSRRRGRFEMAEGGTLFLDEIGDISRRTQVALLRVLQEKTFERVGGTSPIRANVRVICATHRDLRTMVERGEFREDLYYRLRGLTLEVPTLRARLGDLPKIAAHLLERVAAERNEAPKLLSTDALELLGRHRWPGNVRELENVLRAASLFTEGDAIGAADLVENVDELRVLAQSTPQGPLSLRPSTMPAPTNDKRSGDELGEEQSPVAKADATSVAYAQLKQGSVSLSAMKRLIERDCIIRALGETSGNITRAAALLGMKRPRLSQLVKQYGLAASSSEGSQ